jgi:peptidoglycan/xylan/chitin deacetylase (PgdA/CDA1 family)
VGDVLVLCYHAVSDGWPSSLAIAPDRFEDQLGMLLKRGFRGATFERACTAPPSSRTLAVTFDDGYLSVLTQALPVLERLGLPATVFVPTDFVGVDGPMRWPGIDQWVGGAHERELRPMTWEQLGALRDAGWEIGSHTCSHPHLSRLGDRELAHELRESRSACEDRLGSCRTIALPYGDGDARVLAAARDAGYVAVAGLPGQGTPSAGVRRVGVYPADGSRRFAVKVARPVRRLRESGLARPLEAAARIAARVR